jgi:hypothetical protein
MAMNTRLGFGKPPAPPKPSKRSTQRAEAAKQLDQMRSDNFPEYEVYIRIQGKKHWYPVGAIAVKRSNQINQAIFGSQDELVQGAVRLYPVLRKHQQQLEYGYRLKEYKDEPIQLAVPPSASPNGIQGLVAQISTRVQSVFNRPS